MTLACLVTMVIIFLDLIVEPFLKQKNTRNKQSALEIEVKII